METKQRIIYISMKHFIDKGYHAANLEHIADEVGIKKPSLYYHFKSKEEILIKAVEYLSETFQQGFDAIIDTDAVPEEKLYDLMNYMINYNDLVFEDTDIGMPKTLNVLSLFQLAHNTLESVEEFVEEHYNSLKRKLIQVIELGQHKKEFNPEVEAPCIAMDIISRIEGHMTLSRIMNKSCNNNLLKDLWMITSITLQTDIAQISKEKNKMRFNFAALYKKW